MEKVIKLTMAEVNNILAHYMIEHGRLKNKETVVNWHGFNLANMTVELTQEEE